MVALVACGSALVHWGLGAIAGALLLARLAVTQSRVDGLGGAAEALSHNVVFVVRCSGLKTKKALLVQCL